MVIPDLNPRCKKNQLLLRVAAVNRFLIATNAANSVERVNILPSNATCPVISQSFWITFRKDPHKNVLNFSPIHGKLELVLTFLLQFFFKKNIFKQNLRKLRLIKHFVVIYPKTNSSKHIQNARNSKSYQFLPKTMITTGSIHSTVVPLL